MFYRIIRSTVPYLLPLVMLLVVLAACASMGNPGGGLYDETPPVLRRSSPDDGATGVTVTKLTLRFDENVKLDNAMEKLVVSPPQSKMPVVKSNARTVTVELQDTLLPNTTYSIDLGDAVQDNNEGNPLEGLTLTFSTGDHIDSLQVSGVVLNAEDLEPVTGVYVGAYRQCEQPDSTFRHVRMERAGRTDSRGRFTLRGLAPGAYHIYALEDGNTSYTYDLFSERIAFLDSLVAPSKEPALFYDTITHRNPYATGPLDSLIVDSIVERPGFHYYPNDLRLRLFSEGRASRYLDDLDWKDSLRLTLRFASPMPGLPDLSVLGADSQAVASPVVPFLAEPCATYDTISYWIADTMLLKRDTLMVRLEYLYTDTAGLDVLRADTLRLFNPKPQPKPLSEKELQQAQERAEKARAKAARRARRHDKEDKDEADTKPKTRFMSLKMLTSAKLDIGARPRFEVTTPLDTLDMSGLHLLVKRDTLWTPLDFRMERDTLLPRRFSLVALPRFVPGSEYRLVADSASMRDIYGSPIDSTCLSFTELKPEDYAHLLFNVSGTRCGAFVQLLDGKDNPVQQSPMQGGQAKFVNVRPGKYYARLVEDANGNGRFDAGDLDSHTQPEEVFYFGAVLELRANWSFSQSWEVRQTPLEQQKPRDLLKNKPMEKRKRQSRNDQYYR